MFVGGHTPPVDSLCRSFQDLMGRDLAQLDSYFSCIVVCQLPNIKTTAVTEEGRMLIGSELFVEQVTKIRTLIASLLNSRIVDRENRLCNLGGPGRRIITSRQGLWYTMLPRIVQKLNSEEPVHVSRLIDEAWASTIAQHVGHDAPMDIFKAFITFARPPSSISSAAPRLYEDVLMRFAAFHALMCDLSVVLVAGRMRHLDASLLFDDRVEMAARPQLEMLLTMLGDITPCRAVYGEGHKGAAIELGVPVDRPEEPVLCLQEKRVHAKSHRGAGRVKGGGPSMWQRLLAVLPYNPTWNGEYCPALVSRPDLKNILEEVVESTHAPSARYFSKLLDVQNAHSSHLITIDFAPLEAVEQPASTVTTTAFPIATDGTYMDGGPLRIRRAPLHSEYMAYCVACGRKVHSQASTAPSVASSNSYSAGSESSSGGGEADDITAAASYASWTAAVFTEFLGLAALEAKNMLGLSKGSAPKAVSFGGEESATSVVPQAGKRGGLKRTPVAAGTTGSVTRLEHGREGQVQQLTFGLCAGCVEQGLRFNASARAVTETANATGSSETAGACSLTS